MEKNEADDLLLACSHMLRDEVYISDQIERVLETSSSSFSKQQISSLLKLMREMSLLNEEQNAEQHMLISKTENYFKQLNKSNGKWN